MFVSLSIYIKKKKKKERETERIVGVIILEKNGWRKGKVSGNLFKFIFGGLQ